MAESTTDSASLFVFYPLQYLLLSLSVDQFPDMVENSRCKGNVVDAEAQGKGEQRRCTVSTFG